MKTWKLLTLSLLALPMAAKAGTLAELGVDFNKGTNIPVTAEIEKAFANATLLTQDQHGCRYASRKLIYAFEDGVAYLKDDRTSFNAFEASKVLAKGCYLPNQDTVASYRGVRPVRPENQKDPGENLPVRNMSEFGFVLDGQTREAPDRITPALRHAVRFTQRQLGCGDTNLPFIYAFADGLLYADSSLTQVQAWGKGEAEAKGCRFPNVTFANASSFARLTTPDEVMQEKEAVAAASTSGYIDGDYSNQQCGGEWSWTETVPLVMTDAAPRKTPKLTGKLTLADYDFTPKLAPESMVPKIPFSIPFETRISNSGFKDWTLHDEDLQAIKNRCSDMQDFYRDRYAVLNTDAKFYIEKKRLDVEKNALVTEYEPKTIRELCKDGDASNFLIQFQDFDGEKTLSFGDLCRDFSTDPALVKDYAQIVLPWFGKNLAYEKTEDRRGPAIPGEITNNGIRDGVSSEQQSIQKRDLQGKVAYELTWWTVTYNCVFNLRPRLIVPKIIDKVEYKPVPADTDYPERIANLTYLTQRNSMQDRLGLKKDDLLKLFSDKPVTLASTTLETIAKQNATASKTQLAVIDPNSLFIQRSNFVCSSGDHLPAGNRDEAAKKFKFLKDNFREFMGSVDIVEYYTKGYCKAGEPCKLENNPKLEIILRKLQAMGIEKFGFLNDPTNPFTVTPEIAFLETLGIQFPNSYYPDQKPKIPSESEEDIGSAF